MPSTVVGVPAISSHSLSYRRTKYRGSTRRPCPNLTSATTIEKHIAKATAKYSTFSQPKSESPPPNQYNGPMAQHHATHRHASTASVQRAAAPARARCGWDWRLDTAASFAVAGDVMTIYGSRTGQRLIFDVCRASPLFASQYDGRVHAWGRRMRNFRSCER